MGAGLPPQPMEDAMATKEHHLKVVVDTTEADALVGRLKGVAAEIRAENDRRQALLDRELTHLKVRVWSSVTIGVSAVAIVLALVVGRAS